MQWVFLGGYLIVFSALFFGAVLWRRKNRRTRAPFPDNALLLRGPGETLRRTLGALDDRLLCELLLTLVVPIAGGGALAWIAAQVSGHAQTLWLVVVVTGLLIGLFVLIRRLVHGIERWRNTWLGYFGERIVAEALDPIKAHGFQVFHDVPAGEAERTYNIDHVIVGPSGVFAVETKTRRKGRARSGFAEHQIIYDGQVLAFPWGEDRHGLDQARSQAAWLETWLGQLLDASVPVRAILTFPGWQVISRATGDVAVLNPKQIPTAVASANEVRLTARQIELIARQLDQRCRDVEF